jgi:hypothetical protein
MLALSPELLRARRSTGADYQESLATTTGGPDGVSVVIRVPGAFCFALPAEVEGPSMHDRQRYLLESRS